VKDPDETPVLLASYARMLAEAKRAIQAARTRAVLAVNTELLDLYWDLGHLILDRQQAEGPRTKVIDRLSKDLRATFPEVKGLSPGNLDYMRRFAAAWPDRGSSLRVVGKIPWGHNQTLLDRLDTTGDRVWYAQQAFDNGWSRALLLNQIMSQLHLRVGRAPSNFERLLPAGESELMRELTKDPHCLDFISLAKDVSERDFENALLANLDRFLRELGHGYAYIGRQFRLDIDGDERFIDLLMFDYLRSRFLVLELKEPNPLLKRSGN
jgi:predicted nuclease of restriction endonuclease-like (RecB) superfamily